MLMMTLAFLLFDMVLINIIIIIHMAFCPHLLFNTVIVRTHDVEGTVQSPGKVLNSPGSHGTYS